MIDIVEIKQECKLGTLKAFVINDYIYLEDIDTGDCVIIGSIDNE